MSWITIIWAMIASACLTLAAMYVLVWSQRRSQWAHLLFSLVAIGTAGLAFCELWMMRAETPAQFATALRWFQVPGWVVIVALSGFVRIYLRAGRPWLAWTVWVLWTFDLVLDFSVGQNIVFVEVVRVRHIPFLGEAVSIAEGVKNPWMIVAQLGVLLLLIFVTDAAITVWRRGDRRLALTVGGSILFVTFVGLMQGVLRMWGFVHAPLTVSLAFMGFVAAMAWEMSWDAIRAAQLAGDLRESETRMTMAAEAAGVGNWIWTIASNRIWGSAQWLRLFAFEQGEAVTFDKVIQRIHPDDRESVKSAVLHAVETGTNYVGEYRVVLPDDVVRWIAARGRMYSDLHGTSDRMMGAALDITHRKQSEQKIRQKSSELAHLSRINLLGELSGSLAHELNQPLGAILSNAQAARRFLAVPDPNLPDIRNILNDIIKDDKRASEVIHQLRSLVQKKNTEMELVNLNELVRDTQRLLHSELIDRKCKITLRLAPALPRAFAGRVEIQQVLLNLLMNAMDAVWDQAPDQRLLSVETAAVDGTIRVAVRDSGPGIPDAVLPDIFRPFFTTKQKGLGMGLAICRSMIEAYGGRLWAENPAGGGALFQFELKSTREDSGS